VDNPALILFVVGWFTVLIWLGHMFGRWQVAKYLAGTVSVVGFFVGCAGVLAEGREEWLLGWVGYGVAIWLLFKIDRWEEKHAKKLEQLAAARSTAERLLAEAESLVRSYGAALEAAATSKALVVDADRLPAPKDKIKAALLVTLHTTEDPQTREQLKIGYMELAMFQPGVGSSWIGYDVSNIPDPNDREAIRAFATSMAERAPEVERWSTVASEERDQLVEELKRAGLWDQED